MAETIFLKLISGEIPCHKFYEDDLVFAFLDIGPLSEGHALVIPKEPVETLDQLSDEAAAGIGRVLPRLCRAVMAVSGASAYNVLQNNGSRAHQAVFHVHFHIIPKTDDGRGLALEWEAGTLDPERGAEMAERLRAALEE